LTEGVEQIESMTELHQVLNQTALRVATGVYRATPFRRVREVYFRSFLRLVRGRHVVRTVEGMTFDLDLGQMIDVGIFLRQYERDIVTLVERLTQPGWSVLDIGANIGAHALRFAKLVGPSGRVHAFEPMDYAFSKLKRNLSLNDFSNTQAFHLALSDRNVSQERVDFRSSWESDGRRRPEQTVVDFRRLDDWCAEHGVTRIDLIKLDVDGHEFQVVTGGLGMIERNRPVMLIEAGAWHFGDADRNPWQVLADRGYRFWETTTLREVRLDEVRRRLPERDEALTFSINLLASVEEPAPRLQDGGSR
jgi:FkbM family methyltransferase